MLLLHNPPVLDAKRVLIYEQSQRLHNSQSILQMSIDNMSDSILVSNHRVLSY